MGKQRGKDVAADWKGTKVVFEEIEAVDDQCNACKSNSTSAEPAGVQLCCHTLPS